ncbi:MAG: Dyp-type peroxidase [Alphaproteobacteria bacterium]|nr:Dyp-type peroxidase [Alphaproteobacteria bacterium]MBV9203346.1 Dyp-type peroxidase [Alphaproteobacteria bacterium]MBV9375421.1 Dyp-type peroxidase [Alphaproteobacteria bacterium]
MYTPQLELDDIQGDMLVGMQKNAELFLFFKITDARRFKMLMRQYVVGQVTNARTTVERERIIEARKQGRPRSTGPWLGLNLGFTCEGLKHLLGARRPKLDPAFERGAADPATVARLNDPPTGEWLHDFTSDRIDGVFLLAGPERDFVAIHESSLRRRLGAAVKVVYAETGMVRPGREKGHEHFGFTDNISQPGIRGLTRPSRPSTEPDQGLPGQALVWPGEFLLGYPAQNPKHPDRPGPVVPLPASWAKNGSYMVFRRFEQRVPEFRRFVTAQAARLGIYPELLAARVVGRWRSGAPLELMPLEDNRWLGANPMRNNDFSYAGDLFQRACPYAAHIRKANPRDDPPGGMAETRTHRIIRRSIPFGPEVQPGETVTRHRRGLFFVCYQASIERQFEFIQSRYSNSPDFVTGKKRPDTGAPVTPGFDPIIGQNREGGGRFMDEPAPNYPYGNRRTMLEIPEEFVVLTGAAYFFMPSIKALRNLVN